MPKYIVYSLFQSDKRAAWEHDFYVRTFYWNARMNNLIFPDWRTHLEVDLATYNKYPGVFNWLKENNNLSLNINPDTPPLCEGMLWRLKPLFTIDISHVLCRDADALTSYKEAQIVQKWIEHPQNSYPVLSIHDNPGHAGLMGGMVGFDCAWMKAQCRWNSFQDVIKDAALDEHGSDQNLLNRLPIQDGVMTVRGVDASGSLPQVAESLWESNLCSAFIGAPGINEMETIRFFQRHDAYQWKYEACENQYPDLFYWRK